MTYDNLCPSLGSQYLVVYLFIFINPNGFLYAYIIPGTWYTKSNSSMPSRSRQRTTRIHNNSSMAAAAAAGGVGSTNTARQQ